MCPGDNGNVFLTKAPSSTKNGLVLIFNDEETAREIVDTAIYMHRGMGPGLLESTYESVLAFQLSKRGLFVERQKLIDLQFDEQIVERAFAIDLLVNNHVVVELKATDKLVEVHRRQLLTYLKMTGLRVGLLINFGQPTVKEGLCRMVNGYIKT